MAPPVDEHAVAATTMTRSDADPFIGASWSEMRSDQTVLNIREWGGRRKQPTSSMEPPIRDYELRSGAKISSEGKYVRYRSSSLVSSVIPATAACAPM